MYIYAMKVLKWNLNRQLSLLFIIFSDIFSFQDHTWFGMNIRNKLLKHLLRTVNVEHSLMNSHFPIIVGVSSVTTRWLPGHKKQVLGWHPSWSWTLNFNLISQKLSHLSSNVWGGLFESLVFEVGEGEFEVTNFFFYLILYVLGLLFVFVCIAHSGYDL